MIERGTKESNPDGDFLVGFILGNLPEDGSRPKSHS